MRTVLFCYFLLSFGCQTLETGDQVKEAPEIEDDMALSEAIDAAVDFGGQTLQKVVALISKRREWPEANKLVVQRIPDAIIEYPNYRLLHLVKLYQKSTKQADPKIFRTLVSSGRPIAQTLGWTIAAGMPSKEIAAEMDRVFTDRVSRGEEKTLFLSQMALAVQANRSKSAYTLLREGLLAGGNDAFARAMITLDPQRASSDFLEYLAQASPDELRQLNQRDVDMYTCMVILRHFLAHKPPVNHPNFEHLFLYSVSRNQGLADLAHLVLMEYAGEQGQLLAMKLARMADWIQVAFVESVRRRGSPRFNHLIASLKAATPHKHVVDEIQAVR